MSSSLNRLRNFRVVAFVMIYKPDLNVVVVLLLVVAMLAVVVVVVAFVVAVLAVEVVVLLRLVGRSAESHLQMAR